MALPASISVSSLMPLMIPSNRLLSLSMSHLSLISTYINAISCLILSREKRDLWVWKSGAKQDTPRQNLGMGVEGQEWMAGVHNLDCTLTDSSDSKYQVSGTRRFRNCIFPASIELRTCPKIAAGRGQKRRTHVKTRFVFQGSRQKPLGEEMQCRNINWPLGKKYLYGFNDVNMYCFSSLKSIHRICTRGFLMVIEWDVYVINHDKLEI